MDEAEAQPVMRLQERVVWRPVVPVKAEVAVAVGRSGIGRGDSLKASCFYNT